jgi:phosphocarrier protein FPr
MDEAIAAQWALESPYLRERATDLADVRQRVLHLLVDGDFALPAPHEPSILVVEDLAPSHVLQLDPQLVLGICSERGGANSHAGILARGLGIPAVFGVRLELGRLRSASLLALNGDTGQVWVDPDAETLAQLKAARDRWLALRQAARQLSSQPAVTRDGRQIRVAANVAAVADTRAALKEGADGVGLLRSEFLYLDRAAPPSEEEQIAVYAAIAGLLEGRPLVIRTLDVGGDKPLPYLEPGSERNPFLGVRGIRLCLNHPDIFKTQLRAILRAGVGHDVKVMFPMISSVAEVRAAREILAEAQAELSQSGTPFDKSMAVGIMIEVPSAVALADQLAREVDFFSIGTNDLSQYVMAADRTNAGVARLADALHPAVLRLVRATVEAAHAAGIWVGVCGEIAGDPLATPILVGLQVDELSMSPSAVPVVKQAIGALTMPQAVSIAAEAMELENAEAVRLHLRQRLCA